MLRLSAPRLLLLAALPLLQLASAAENDGFRVFQDAAPEFVRVEIHDVQIDQTRGIFASNRTRVNATARVIEVLRTASSLTPGATIQIRYDHQARGGNSAETPPILKPGQVVPAFLSRKGTSYVPAARHLSFLQPTEAQMQRYDAAHVRTREALLLETERRVLQSLNASTQPSPPTTAPDTPVLPLPTEIDESTPPPTLSTADDLPLPQEEITNEISPPPQPPLRSQPVVETLPPEPSVHRAQVVPAETNPSPPPSGPEVNPPLTPSEPITPLPVLPPAPQTNIITIPSATSRNTELGAREGYSAVYSLIKKGEAAQLQGNRAAAKESYTLAREKLLKLKAEQPEFQPFMVEYRLRDLKRRLDHIETAEKMENNKP